MSIVTEKVKLATERFLLVRLTPGRYIEPAFLSGSTYQQTFSYPIARVERNGVELTLVSSLANDDEYTYDESTGLLQVQLAAAPDPDTNVLVVFYYLFYTGTVFRAISEDPENTATTVREWQPRLSNYPVVGQSFSNILAGIFTIADTSIDIINHDGSFQAYLTDDDSFYNKAVDIWLCISDVSNIQKIFTGTVNRIAITQTLVTLEVVDSFNKLKQPAYMGDTVDESVYRLAVSSFPDLDPKHNDVPVPYIVGNYSRYQTRTKTGVPSGAPSAYEVFVGSEASCTNYSTTTSTTTNRQWGCCRQKGAVATQSFGAVQANLDTGTGFRFVRFASVANVQIGDTIKWTEAAVDYYGIVNYIGSFTYSSVVYNVIFSDPSGTFTNASTVANLKSFSTFIEAQNETLSFVQPRYGRDYTVSEVATSGGNNYVSLTFVNNFEASHAGFTKVEPDFQRVYFRTSNATVQKHGDILKEIMSKVGLSTSASTFTAADAALPVACRFHIPNFDEVAADTYLKYCQDVLESTLGYLKINSSFEVEYNLLTAPTSTDVRDSFLMIDAESSCEIEYQDIATKIIGYNPHNDSGDAIVDANTPSASADNFKARYLHGIVNVNRFRHVLEELTSKISDHIGIKSMRSAKYSFSTATQDIDTELGTDLQMENKILLGQSTATDVKVISIEKSPSKIFIKASDLKGL